MKIRCNGCKKRFEEKCMTIEFEGHCTYAYCDECYKKMYERKKSWLQGGVSSFRGWTK